MKTKKRISVVNLPVKFPVTPTILAALCLDHWNAAGWVCGVVWTVVVLFWVVSIVAFIAADHVDLFAEAEESEPLKKEQQDKEVQYLKEFFKPM